MVENSRKSIFRQNLQIIGAKRERLIIMNSEEKKYRKRIQTLEEALRNLIDKLDAVEPTLQGWAVLAHIHGQRYDGPTYENELRCARELLKE